MAQAYSYVRFSSEKQALGDSVRRQMKMAEDYAVEHGLTLDNTTYQDPAMSAFRGKNSEDGLLGVFLAAVDAGVIPKGSYLLVESLDRISRAEVDDALELFLRIIKRGIILVTLTDRQIFSKEKIKQDKGISLIISITMMIRAHEESATKQHRISQAWKNKRSNASDTGKIMTAMCPSWLTLSTDRKSWIIDPVKVAVVQRIFDLTLAGNGTPTIARLFNSEGVPTMKRAGAWTFGVVNAILKNEAVIGTYVPKKVVADSVKGYYPQIITDAEYFQVRETLIGRRWVGGRNQTRVLNLFSGICQCAVCNSSMRIRSAITGGKTYIQCNLAYSGGDCTAAIFPYYAAERAVLQHLGKVVSKIAIERPSADPKALLRARRADIDKKINNLVSALADTNTPQIREMINNLQTEANDIDAQIFNLIDPGIKSDSTAEALEMLSKLKKKLTVKDRLKVQTVLKRVIDCIYFNSEVPPTIAIKYLDHIQKHTDFIDVKPYMDPVGGDRRTYKTSTKPESK